MMMHPEMEETAIPAIESVLSFVGVPNIADLLSDEALIRIGTEAVEGFERDQKSLEQWRDDAEEAMRLAKMRRVDKTGPTTNPSNIMTPLLGQSAVQFAARAYPTILNDNKPVKFRVLSSGSQMPMPPMMGPQGPLPPPTNGDPLLDRAARLERHMSYQLLEEMEEWEGDTDTLLSALPIVGMGFRKVHRCPIEGRNKSEYVPATRIVADNDAGSWSRAPRISQEFELHGYEVEERMRAGLFLRAALDAEEPDENEAAEVHSFIEQHTRLDLDEDGYAEPYIVTVHRTTGKVVRIFANFTEEDVVFGEEIVRISAQQHFIPYTFMPDPDGGLYGLGFGHFLLSLGHTQNTIINQLLDAGTLSNAGGGFVSKAFKRDPGEIKLKMNTWYKSDLSPMDLAQAFVPFPRPQPDATLFSLLGYIDDMGQRITSSADAMLGSVDANMQPTTLLALIEQGQKVFNAIYKRIYRSLKQEFKALARLNALHLSGFEYFVFGDTQNHVAAIDYNLDDLDVIPAAEPNMASDVIEMGRAGVLQQFLGDPMVDQLEIRKRLLKAAKITDFEKLIVPPPPPPQTPPPDPVLMLETAKLEQQERRVAVEEAELRIKQQEAAMQAKTDRLRIDLDTLRAEIERDKLALESERLVFERDKMAIEAKKLGIELVKADAEATLKEAQAARTLMDP